MTMTDRDPKMNAPIVLVAGGTGGHVFPAEALAGELNRLGHALALRRLTPSVVVGFGGYTSVPALMAASSLRLPTLIHEQNAFLGRANRLLAPRVTAIATSFPKVEKISGAIAAKAVLTGNPVRPAVAALRDVPYQAPAVDGEIQLLVTGGSQGARILSEVIPAALGRLDQTLRDRIRLAQQCRPEDIDAVRAAYAEMGLSAEVAPFFQDMADRLARAHLVICRSGASTVAELTVAGRPAILVPYAHAADDHQSFNARAVVDAGGARMMPEQEFTPDALAAQLTELASKPETLAAMARDAHGAGHADAAAALARLATSLIGGGRAVS
jgi:UDP-N-acetylglucosamine--N-acetylmuramyl-(pentapeptide) pyrophosphoryl-undecaprenol N-acetylglucosamine transferase